MCKTTNQQFAVRSGTRWGEEVEEMHARNVQERNTKKGTRQKRHAGDKQKQQNKHAMPAPVLRPGWFRKLHRVQKQLNKHGMPAQSSAQGGSGTYTECKHNKTSTPCQHQSSAQGGSGTYTV